MYDIKSFGLKEMTECGTVLRNIGTGSKTMEEASGKIVRYFYDQFIDKESNKNACVLARLFKTHPYGELDEKLQNFVGGLSAGKSQAPDMKCLTLLATAGELPEWNLPEKSNGHQAIPLMSEQFVSAVPMISNLIQQLGLEIKQVVKPDSKLLLDISKKKYNVFYVPNALGSPYIPSQEKFVIPFKVKSVVGFGGVLPSGNLFATILFTRVLLAQETADLFKTLALNVKLALLPLEGQVFAE